MDITVNQSLVIGSTWLSKDVVAGSSSFTVENSETFTTANGLLVIGQIGSPNAECINVISGKTATVITTSTSCSFAHQRGEPIQQVQYNQVIIESSTSPTSGFSVIATINIQWSAEKTQYNDTAGTASTYYRQRFTNSVLGTFSDYSNGGVGVSQNDLGPTTASSIISSVRSAVGNTDLPDSFFISALNDARREADTKYGYGRMNEWRHKFDYPLQMLAGTNYVTLPSDIDFNETNRSLFQARYSRQGVAFNVPLRYVDKREWNLRAYLNRFSTTSSAVLSGATTLPLANTGDFGSSGTVTIATENPTQSLMTVTFTGNNLSTNTLTGCTGITRNISSGVQVWAFSTFSVPMFYTVFDDPTSGAHRLWFDRPIPASLQGKNLYIDYYKKIVDIVFMSDTIPEHYRDVYKDYLKFAIKRRRDDSLGEDDQDYKKFMRGIANIMGNPYTGQSQIIIQ